jgi:tetratricopeptide (TPR) repeat protein
LGNFESALIDAQNAVQLDPKFAKGYLRIAGCQIVNGDFELARMSLQSAKEHADVRGLVEVERELSRLDAICKNVSEFEKCWSKEDWRASVYYANKVIESAPRMYVMVARKAEALVYNKKVDEALLLMADVLRMDDKNLDAIFVRGNCFTCDLKHPGSDPSSILLMFCLRIVLLSSGQFRKGDHPLQKGIAAVA